MGCARIFAVLASFAGTGLCALPDSLPLKPYGLPAPAAFKECLSFQEIPGRDGVYLVVQKAGELITYEPRTGKTAPWLKLTVNTAYEEGITSVAFHPDFARNGKYYALYNPPSNGSLPGLQWGKPGAYTEYLDEYVADGKLEKDSGRPPRRIGEFCCKDGPGHNGQYVMFGPDRMLYLTVGDGNSDGRDTQTRQTLLGTVLRIDVDKPDPGREYGIPADNPFFNDNDPKVRREIWSYGFRQPYKLHIDAKTKGIWVGNVGGWNEDHVSLIKRGSNFGWPITEGAVCFDDSKTMFQYTAPKSDCDRTGITPPSIGVTHSYPRGNVNTNCVIGPVVYRGNAASPLDGVVFYADHTAQKLHAARVDAVGRMIEMKEYPKTRFQIIHLYQASDGRLLVSGMGSNQFFYVDDPGLLMGPAARIAAPARAMGPARSGGAGFDAAGKRRREARAPVWRGGP